MRSQGASILVHDESQDILHALVEDVLRHAHEVMPHEEAPGVMLDVESNGIRCVLLRTQPNGREAALSPREQEIARMVARGLPNKAIAALLEISTWTVGTYLRRIFAKLNVSSRAAMVARWGGGI